jgi:hypothetical protein
MKSIEATSLKEVIHTVLGWARGKKAGPVKVNISPEAD